MNNTILDIKSNELEWEKNKRIEESEVVEKECKKLYNRLDDLEESFRWLNNRSKQLNDSLLEMQSDDLKLQKLLIEREDLMRKRLSVERILLSECRDMVDKRMIEAEEMKEGRNGEYIQEQQ